MGNSSLRASLRAGHEEILWNENCNEGGKERKREKKESNSKELKWKSELSESEETNFSF
jgi:hypothetical protein